MNHPEPCPLLDTYRAMTVRDWLEMIAVSTAFLALIFALSLLFAAFDPAGGL